MQACSSQAASWCGTGFFNDLSGTPARRALPLFEQPLLFLRQFLRNGRARDHVKIAVAGDLADFPFADSRKGQFLVTFKVADVTLDYASAWEQAPPIAKQAGRKRG